MKNVLEFLEATCRKVPSKVGFVDLSRQESFSELCEKARKIGTALSSLDSKRPVAILIDKTINCIDCMIGSLYANDFYVVVDVKSPRERIECILDTLDDPIILTDRKNESFARSFARECLIYEDLLLSEEDTQRLLDIRMKMCDMDTAYILFTSGSTGKPKGTVISHRALISYITWAVNTFGFHEETVFGSQTPLYFSMSVTDLFSTIACGCIYDIIPKQHFSFPIDLVSYLNAHKINTIYWVPTAISILSNWKVFDVVKPEYIKVVLFAGEVMPTKQINYWIKKLDRSILYANLFGPTETTDICTYYVIDRAFSDIEALPIGRHCDNCDVFIIKEDGTIAKDGEEGELFVRSSFMADGYYRDPDKTGEAFVQNPCNPYYPERVYKTGDIVRYNERGELIYIARKDFQIKRMGYRIELGEIEAAANSLEKVRACACVFDKEQNLVVLIYEGGEKNTQKVFEAVKEKVPTYMIPDRVIRIKEMPKNANGKIDRSNLLKTYQSL